MTRGPVIPGLDWVISAGEGEMLAFLGTEVICPRCGEILRQDPDRAEPYLADRQGHRFSNVRALVVELYQRDMLRPKVAATIRRGRLDHSAA